MPGGDTRSTAWFQPYPPFVGRGAWRSLHRHRRQPLHRAPEQLHVADSRPRASGGGRGDPAAGCPRQRLRRTARGHDAPVADPRRADAHRRPGPVRQLRHRGRDDGSPRRTRLHRPTADRKGGGRLPRDMGRHHRQRRAAARSGRPGRAADTVPRFEGPQSEGGRNDRGRFPSTTSRRRARSSSRSATNSPASSSSP